MNWPSTLPYKEQKMHHGHCVSCGVFILSAIGLIFQRHCLKMAASCKTYGDSRIAITLVLFGETTPNFQVLLVIEHRFQ